MEPPPRLARFIPERGAPMPRRPEEIAVDQDKTDQKRDADGHWVSDLKPGATKSAKQDKRLEDTFPASDPAVRSGTTGFVAPDGTEMNVEGPGKATARNATEDLPKQG